MSVETPVARKRKYTKKRRISFITPVQQDASGAMRNRRRQAPRILGTLCPVQKIEATFGGRGACSMRGTERPSVSLE